jgi:small subunit ribosomal protein S17
MPRRILEGDVVSDKMDKTVTVLVERRFMHPVYKKYVKRTDKYAAHDENNAFAVGDRVQIEECRPISKRKKWQVITVPAGGGASKAKKEAPVKNVPEEKEAKAKEVEEIKEAAAAEEKKPVAEKAAPEKATAKKTPAKGKKDAEK